MPLMSDQYHLSLNPISRTAGRSATASVAYRAGEMIIDERTGAVHDYRRKRGVEHKYIVLPGGGTIDRSVLWNAVEKSHKRGDAVLIREIEIAIPIGLNAARRRTLIEGYAHELADRYRVAVDVAIHEPHPVNDVDLKRDPNQFYVEEIEVLKDGKERTRRHNGNYHAHVSMSACYVNAEGMPGKKCIELDPVHCRCKKILNPAQRERPRWAELANTALAAAGSADRIDHRSHKARGIERVPTEHRGPAANAVERKTGQASRRRLADALRIAAVQAEREALCTAQAAVDAAVAKLAAAEADLAAEIAAADALAQTGASGTSTGSAAEAGQAVPVLAIDPAPVEAERPAPSLPQGGGLRVVSAEERARAGADIAAFQARQRAQKAAEAARKAAQSAQPAQAQEAPPGEPGLPGVVEDRKAVRASDKTADSSDALHTPLQVRGRDASVPPPPPRAIKTQAPTPTPAVPLAVQLSQAQEQFKGRKTALRDAEAQETVRTISAHVSAAAAQALQDLEIRRDELREERRQLSEEIDGRSIGARLRAAVHDPQQARIEAIYAEQLQVRSKLKLARAAVARAGPVPTAAEAWHDEQARQTELKRLREAVEVAKAEVERIEREQRRPDWQQWQQQPGDFDRDR